MKLPTVEGIIERRILANYRVDPGVLAATLPAPFRPKLHAGFGMAGICLIRLGGIRPKGFPSLFGMSSENAAHRTIVEWDEGGEVREGVYVRRRDTSSLVNSLAGGRILPGIQHFARFEVVESERHFSVSFAGRDGSVGVSLECELAWELPNDSVFGSLDEASQFFERGSVGFSETPDPTRYHGIELRCREWRVEPLRVKHARSSVFDDPKVFPPGSIQFDNALLMRNIRHEWNGLADLCCKAPTSREARL